MKPFSGTNATSHDYYCKLIAPIRAVAKEYGYQITIEGSIAHSIDLVAIPWVKDPVPIEALVKAVVATCQRTVQRGQLHSTEPEQSNWRMVWSIHLGGSVYIDLSVMSVLEPT